MLCVYDILDNVTVRTLDLVEMLPENLSSKISTFSWWKIVPNACQFSKNQANRIRVKYVFSGARKYEIS